MKVEGDVTIFRTERIPQPIINLDANNGAMSAGGHGEDGLVQLSDDAGSVRASLSGGSGSLILREKPAGTGTFGAPLGQEAVQLTAKDSTLCLDVAGKHRIRLEGSGGNIWVGGNGPDGDLALFAAEGDNETVEQATIHLNGGNGAISLRATDTFHPNGQEWIRLEAKWVAGPKILSRICLRGPNPKDEFGAAIDTIVLDGEAGDIILKNSDCAEEFESAQGCVIEPGTVMVIGEEEILQPSTTGYDKRVAGVISGAGDLKPGITLGKIHSSKNRVPVALLGRTYCKVDARYSQIETGDLLTTSPTPGHAMKVTDATKAFGAVLGKALKPHRQGVGLIPVLVALQ